MATAPADLTPTPDHVPAELVVDFDLYNIPGGDVDPQAAWRAARPKGPLAWSPRNGGHWIAATPEAVFRFYRDFEHFSASELSIPKMGQEYLMVPNQVDPPMHAGYRRNIMPLFTPDAIEVLAEDVRELCVELIEEARPRGECEFVMDFAMRFPLGIFMRLMGLPDSDRMYLRGLVEKFSDSPDPAEKSAAASELGAYIDRIIDDRIANPRNDATTRVTQMQIDGRPYTLAEMRGTIRLLMAGGLDTVAGMLCFIVRHFALYPDDADFIRSKLGDDKAMMEIVQEFLRRYNIVSSSRMVVEDYEWQGVTLKKGEMVLMPSAFFNMDDDRPDPIRVDFERKNKRHITFGSGTHACAGALLAREEINVFLEEWLTRMPPVRLDPARPPVMKAMSLNGAESLWLQWDV